MQHQAQGLQRMFSGQGARMLSVLAGPSAQGGLDFFMALAAELARRGNRVWLVQTDAGRISQRLGCRPLLPWRPSLPLGQQIIQAGAYGLIHAPGIMAGDGALAEAARASRSCDWLLFDAGRFSHAGAPLEPLAEQTVLVLLGKRDAEAGYALVKGLSCRKSPARVLLAGGPAEAVAQTARDFLNRAVESLPADEGVCQIGNNEPGTSSKTLTIAPNLTKVVSRILQNDQPKVAHGGCGKGAEEVNQR